MIFWKILELRRKNFIFLQPKTIGTCTGDLVFFFFFLNRGTGDLFYLFLKNKKHRIKKNKKHVHFESTSASTPTPIRFGRTLGRRFDPADVIPCGRC